MSITTEITRLQNAKADMKASIEDKGITVAASDKIDVYSDYIDELGYLKKIDGDAYEGTVPSVAEDMAEIAKFGGKSMKWNQLAPTGYSHANNCLVAFTAGATIVAGHKYYLYYESTGHTGTSKLSVYARIDSTNQSCFGQAISQSDSSSESIQTASYGGTSTGSTTATDGNVWLYQYHANGDNGYIFSSVKLIDLTELYGEGNEPSSLDDAKITAIKTYAGKNPSYYAGGILNASVTSIVSKSRNLLNPADISFITAYGIQNEIQQDGGIRYYGTVTGTSLLTLQYRSITVNVAGFHTQHPERSVKNLKIVDRVGNISYCSFLWDSSAERIIIYCTRTDQNPIDFTAYPMVYEGTLPTEYSPYFTSTLSIPSAVQALPGYGVGMLDGSAYNYVDWENKVYHQVCEVSGNDVVMLANPVETDIGSIISPYNALKVSAGGTITFENSAKLSVPNTIGYYKDIYAPDKHKPTEIMNISANGTYNVTECSSVVVNYISKYVIFTAEQPNSTIALTQVGTFANPWQIKYSADYTTWNDYTIGSVITLANVGDFVIFAGDGNVSDEMSDSNYYKFVMTGLIAGSGNCYGLISQDDSPCCFEYCFCSLFRDCTSLTTAPALPATTLANFCYLDMFTGCTSLISAPALPATTLAAYCYSDMFYGCISLTTTPVLPATTLADNCYGQMFLDCKALTTAPALPATTLASSCYIKMFSGCSALINPPALPATTLAAKCYGYMFQNCTALTSTPALPATTLARICYQGMFKGCTSLIAAPVLPATTLASQCYGYMFLGCTSLITAPALPATTLASVCYQGMFEGCASLTTAPALPATTLAEDCYSFMFSSCSSLISAPALPATTLAERCYYMMFQVCKALITIPALPATTLAANCYGKMFYGCIRLKVYLSSGADHDKAWRIPTSGDASSYTSQTEMFYNTIGDYATASTVDLNTTFYTQNDPI